MLLSTLSLGTTWSADRCVAHYGRKEKERVISSISLAG